MLWDEPILAASGRLLIALYFLVSALLNLTPARIKDHIDRMAGYKTPFPAPAFWIGIAMQFLGATLLIVNWRPDLGVYCLIVFTVAATLIFHRFWNMSDPMKRNFSRITLLGNAALLGGLLLLLQNVR